MTRTASSPVRVDCTAQPQAVALVWDLATRVGRRLDTSNGADAPVAVELAAVPSADGTRAGVTLSLVLRSGARRELMARAGLPAAWCRRGGYRHLDIAGVVACSFRADGGERAVFARCAWLGDVGVPAGSYSLGEGAGT